MMYHTLDELITNRMYREMDAAEAIIQLKREDISRQVKAIMHEWQARSGSYDRTRGIIDFSTPTPEVELRKMRDEWDRS